MSEEYPRRGRNWLTAMGVLFLVVATVTLVRDIIIWSPDFVVGDDINSVKVVNDLINEIEGLRPIYLGGGKLSYLVEMSTPLLLNAMIKNKMKNPGIKII